MGIEVFKKHLREKRAIKISVGSRNFNLDNVAKICRAAQESRASAIEIPVDKNVYNVARKNAKLPLFVSSFHPFEILEAVKMGVDAIIIGNYYEMYKKGYKYNSTEIYDIVLETMSMISEYDVFTCVTIPASLNYKEQCELIKKLEILGVDLIQTEGYKKSSANQNLMVESAEFSIKTMSELLKYSNMQFMASSAMNLVGLKAAFDNGANAVAVDSAINQLDSEVAMKTAIREMIGCVSYRNSIHKEIIRSERELLLKRL